MEGMNEIQANIEALRARLIQQAGAAADESAHLLESYAKATPTPPSWKDRTGALRNSIKGRSEVSGDVATIVVSESMVYAPFVEEGTRRSRPYPSLWPAVAANAHNVQAIFARHMKV